MSKMFDVRLPSSHPHISQTFHLLWDHTDVTQPGQPVTDGRHPIFVTAVADHNDLMTMTLPGSFVGGHIREYVETGRAGGRPIVIDGATEGWAFDTAVFEPFHRNLAELGVDPADVILITTNYLLPPAYNAWTRRLQITPIKFFVFDFWCYKLSVQLREQLGSGADDPDAGGATFQVRKKLLSFNRVPKAHRVAVILKLIEANQVDSSIVSFMPDVTGVDPARAAAELAYYHKLGWPVLTALLRYWPELVRMVPLRHDQDASTEYLTYVFGSLQSDDYAEVGFTVITESDFGVGSVDRVTEKPFKAVANHCPFLIVGQERQLARMQSLGFEPYQMFDNSYDGIADPNRRLGAVLDEVSRLACLDVDRLQELRLADHATARRNFQRLLSFSTKTSIEGVARDFAKTLESASTR